MTSASQRRGLNERQTGSHRSVRPDCSNCKRCEDNLTDRLARLIQDKSGVPEDEVTSNGCRNQDGAHYHLTKDGCATLDCVESKGVEFCCDCSDFPNALIVFTADGAASYPHNMKVYNLCRNNQVGLDRWIEEAGQNRKNYFTGKFVICRGLTDR